MSDKEKRIKIAEILEVEENEISEDDLLRDYDTWDSVAVLSVIALMDEYFDKLPHASEVAECKTIKDLIEFMNE